MKLALLKKYFLFLCVCCPLVSFALPTWKIIPNQSTLTFKAIQNNAPITGAFTDFNGNIQFDPTNLQASHVEIEVDTSSIKTGDTEISDLLRNAGWFNVEIFPRAYFKAKNFIKVGDKTYRARGNLTIRDKTIPVDILFDLDILSDNKAHAKGTADLNRVQFDVGQGDWSKTDVIQATVKVEFELYVKK